MVSGFELAPRPYFFAVLDLHEVNVPLIWCSDWSSGLWTNAGMLLLLLRAPHPLCSLPYFLMHV